MGLLKFLKKIFGVAEKQQETKKQVVYVEKKVRKVVEGNKYGVDNDVLYSAQFVLGNKYFIEEDAYRKHRALTFDFIPKQQANKNVRSFLEWKTRSYKTWQTIRNRTERLKKKCDACYGNSQDYGKNYIVECHEVWSFNPEKREQKLIKLRGLCVICHKVVHADNQHRGNKDILNGLIEHYAIVNKISLKQAFKEYEIALERKKVREQLPNFYLNLNYFEKWFKDLEIPYGDRIDIRDIKEKNKEEQEEKGEEGDE